MPEDEDYDVERGHHLSLLFQFYKQLDDWGMSQAKDFGEELAHVLGYKDYAAFARDISPKDIKTMEALTGPNGYAVYKMLKARQDA